MEANQFELPKTPINPSRKLAWNSMKQEVIGFKDGLGKGLDVGITDTIVALRCLGINTTQSCEGHLDWATGAPYVDIRGVDTKELEVQAKEAFNNARTEHDANPTNQQIYSPLYEKAHGLRKEIATKHLAEVKKAFDLIAEFYQNKQTPYDKKLILSPFGDGSARIESQGAIFQEIAKPEVKKKKLQEYQEEMNSFTIFLKDKFLNTKSSRFKNLLKRLFHLS